MANQQIKDIDDKWGEVETEKKSGLLHYVIRSGKESVVDVVKFLIKERGCDVNYELESPFRNLTVRPIQLAIQMDYTDGVSREIKLDLVKTLVTFGAIVGIDDVSSAIYNEVPLEIVRVLVDGLSSVHERQTLWYAICCRDNDTYLDLLLEKSLIEVNDTFDDITPIIEATQRKNIPVINFLLKHGANLRLKSNLYDSFSAAIGLSDSHPQLFDVFFDTHDDVNSCCNSVSNVPLCIATFKGELYALRRLLAHSEIDPSKFDAEEHNALDGALWNLVETADMYRWKEDDSLSHRFELVRECITGGVPLNPDRSLSTEDGELHYSVLERALMFYNADMVDLLLRAGANPWRCRPADLFDTQLSTEQSEQYEELFKRLIIPCRNTSRPLLELCRIKIINILAVDRRGRSFSQRLADTSLPHVLKLYVEKF